MSVIVYEYDEFEGVANSLNKMVELEPVIMSNSYVVEYNSRQMPQSFKYTMESVVGRLLWYMYVANRIAYSLQYQENLNIFEPERPAKKFNERQAADKFGSFMYNIYTNNGTVFLSKEWLGLAEDISEALKFLNKSNTTFAEGGQIEEGYYTNLKSINDIKKVVGEKVWSKFTMNNDKEQNERWNKFFNDHDGKVSIDVMEDEVDISATSNQDYGDDIGALETYLKEDFEAVYY